MNSLLYYEVWCKCAVFCCGGDPQLRQGCAGRFLHGATMEGNDYILKKGSRNPSKPKLAAGNAERGGTVQALKQLDTSEFSLAIPHLACGM